MIGDHDAPSSSEIRRPNQGPSTAVRSFMQALGTRGKLLGAARHVTAPQDEARDDPAGVAPFAGTVRR